MSHLRTFFCQCYLSHSHCWQFANPENLFYFNDSKKFSNMAHQWLEYEFLYIYGKLEDAKMHKLHITYIKYFIKHVLWRAINLYLNTIFFVVFIKIWICISILSLSITTMAANMLKRMHDKHWIDRFENRSRRCVG